MHLANRVRRGLQGSLFLLAISALVPKISVAGPISELLGSGVFDIPWGAKRNAINAAFPSDSGWTDYSSSGYGTYMAGTSRVIFGIHGTKVLVFKVDYESGFIGVNVLFPYEQAPNLIDRMVGVFGAVPGQSSIQDFSNLPFAAYGIRKAEYRWPTDGGVSVRLDCGRPFEAAGRTFDGNCAVIIEGVGLGLGLGGAAFESQPPEEEEGVGTGTGFFVNQNGTILTSNHVVEGSSRIAVSCGMGEESEARVLASSKSTDVAVLSTDIKNSPYLMLSKPRSLSVGQSIFTYGFPAVDLLGAEPKFTEGSVSSLSGIAGEQAYFQMSVPVQPGNSGGPVVNDRGEVVGVVAAVAAIESFLTSTGTLPQNVNWAVKSEHAAVLFDAPPPQPSAKGREEAIKRVRESLCFIVVGYGSAPPKQSAEIGPPMTTPPVADTESLVQESTDDLRRRYAARIQGRIERAWIKPRDLRSGLSCEVRVTQVPGGTVTGVQFGACNGDESVRQSIEEAIQRASPLPEPPVAELFDPNIVLTFRPD